MPVNTYTQLTKYDKKYKRNTEWKFNVRRNKEISQYKIHFFRYQKSLAITKILLICWSSRLQVFYK